MSILPSQPPVSQPKQVVLSSELAALRDLIIFAEQQHQPRPCSFCAGKGTWYDIYSEEEKERTCSKCGGAGCVHVLVNRLASLDNISAAKALLNSLYGPDNGESDR